MWDSLVSDKTYPTYKSYNSDASGIVSRFPAFGGEEFLKLSCIDIS